jgi:hypothetical membrane protein
MTTIGITHDHGHTGTEPVRGRGVVVRASVTCGILSSLLYLATDLLGGAVYGGYSFTSQAISELAAIGAASKSVVDPLFVLYDVLLLAFGMGIILTSVSRERALQTTAATLVGVGALGLAAGFVGPFFSMHERGAGNLGTDAPHIILTGVIVVLLLIAIAAGAFAFGKVFRLYSIATIVTALVFGGLTVPFAARLAAGESTRGLGILERINVYSIMLWIAVLSVTLLQRPDSKAHRVVP